MENRIFRKSIHLAVNIMALTLKLFYISIFISNHFRTQTHRERERERRDHLYSPSHWAHSLTLSSTLSLTPNAADPLPHAPHKISTLLRKFLSSLTLIIHAKPKPKDEESYCRWSPDPVPDPRPCRPDRAAQTHRWFDHATSAPPLCSNPSPMNPVWLCSPSPPLRDLTSISNPVASLSSFSQFDRIWWIFFFGFCFFCVSLFRNDIIYLFGSWENVSNK